MFRTWFSGSHDLGSGALCTRLHGHRWTVDIKVTEEPDRLPDKAALMRALMEIRNELHGRDVNAMIAPSLPDVHGIAAWFMERLLLRFPINEVTVWQDDELGATLWREGRL